MSISEQVKELRAYGNSICFLPKTRDIFGKAADTIESLSAKLQAANMERPADCGVWIPCKERLPDDFETVIAYTDENQIVSVARDGQDWVLYDGNIISEKVIAWQHLPEPYHNP